MDSLERLLDFPGVEAHPPQRGAIRWIEARSGLRLPDSVRDYFQTCGGADLTPLDHRLLGPDQVVQLLQNWPRFGSSQRWGCVPLVEDCEGDLYCVCCQPPHRGQICRLTWTGDQELRFDCLDHLLAELLRLCRRGA